MLRAVWAILTAPYTSLDTDKLGKTGCNDNGATPLACAAVCEAHKHPAGDSIVESLGEWIEEHIMDVVCQGKGGLARLKAIRIDGDDVKQLFSAPDKGDAAHAAVRENWPEGLLALHEIGFSLSVRGADGLTPTPTGARWL